MRKNLLILFTFCLHLTVLAQTTDNDGVAYFRSTGTPDDTLAVSTALATAADSTVALSTDTLPYPQYLCHRIDALLGLPMLQRSQVGIMVYDLTADSAIYCHNERQTMRPASTEKLVTAIAAIDKLGGAYQLQTSLRYKGTVENGTLTGSVYCIGSMDPAFNTDDMTAFVEQLRRLGVDTIRGSIVEDRLFKDDNMLGEGWCWDDDNPTLSPLLFNGKATFSERFVQALRHDGITVEAPLTTGTTPTDARHVCTRSHTIDQILSKMMKSSDNLYAEALFYHLAASTGNRPAKASHARQLIERLIRKTGLNPQNYKIADGSGLSLYNYLSPELHIQLLRYAYTNANVLENLLPALPIAAEDGTLRNRMAGTAAAGNVRAKTGTVTCVSALAGYCTAANGHDLCFAIMNQGVMRVSDGRAFQDRVCQAMCAAPSTPLQQAIAPVATAVKKAEPRKAKNVRVPHKSKKKKKGRR